jgi:endo-1,4-beta-xylanase
MKRIFLFLLVAFSTIAVSAQPSFTGFQAESGTLGSEWTTATVSGTTVVRSTTTGGGQNPVSANRVISYTVTFPQAGTYNLFARVWVNAGTFNDDSYYYGNGFGAKSPTNDDDWITANGLAAAGYTVGTDYVSGAGTAGSNVFKWVNMSVFNGGENPITFTVTAGALTQTFQIGAREDGLDIDRFVFGLVNYNYTVNNLNNGENGSDIPPPPPFNPPGPPIATGKPKFLGGVTSPSQSVNFDKYWNQVTPENAGKWGVVEGTRDVMNWAELDASYTLAKSNGFPFKLHTLIWGSQQPAWIESLPASEQREEIEEWFAALAVRYPAIDFIEVVNEPLHAKPDAPGRGNYINALGGNGASGWEWVLQSFRLARQYFPTAKLWINDYSIINSSSSTATYMTIINLLKAENLIDGIGEQGHAFTTFNTPLTTMQNNLNTLATSGLPLYITELDIDGAPVQTATGDNAQLTEYQRVFPMFWTHPAIKGVTLWGYRPGHWRSAQGAYLAYDNGAERPALVWLRSYVQATPLPINLKSFDVAKRGNYVRLSWSATNEINNDYYEIERSGDGYAYAPLLKVRAAVGQADNEYYAEDLQPLKGKNFYRLVQYDKDGRKTVQGTRVIAFDKAAAALYVQTFPNPAASFITIRTEGSVKTAMITDAAGKLVKTIAIPSSGVQTIGTADFANGVYFIRVANSETSETATLIINKKQ